MNSKAMKQTLAWPPQLNMSDNKPHIYSEFNTVERNNAPYLNEMLSPVHVKNLGAEYIHDFKGNKYHIDVHQHTVCRNTVFACVFHKLKVIQYTDKGKGNVTHKLT